MQKSKLSEIFNETSGGSLNPESIILPDKAGCSALACV